MGTSSLSRCNSDMLNNNHVYGTYLISETFLLQFKEINKKCSCNEIYKTSEEQAVRKDIAITYVVSTKILFGE